MPPAVAKKNWKRAYIGIDIGGTKSLYALLDENFEVIAEEKLRTIPEKGGLRRKPQPAFSLNYRRTVPAGAVQVRGSTTTSVFTEFAM